MPGAQPHAHCYCGHQFGSFAGQLGDGAAMYLGEVQGPSGRYAFFHFYVTNVVVLVHCCSEKTVFYSNTSRNRVGTVGYLLYALMGVKEENGLLRSWQYNCWRGVGVM